MFILYAYTVARWIGHVRFCWNGEIKEREYAPCCLKRTQYVMFLRVVHLADWYLKFHGMYEKSRMISKFQLDRILSLFAAAQHFPWWLGNHLFLTRKHKLFSQNSNRRLCAFHFQTHITLTQQHVAQSKALAAQVPPCAFSLQQLRPRFVLLAAGSDPEFLHHKGT